MRTLLVVLVALSAPSLTAGCGGARATADAARSDAAANDAGVDAFLDEGSKDGGARDAGPRDSGSTDATMRDAGRDAGATDAGASDAGADASRDAATIDGGPLGTLIQCAPPVPAGPGSGIVFDSNFWSGFRFEITGAGAHVTRVGLQITPAAAGTVFGALVRLTGSSDTPDDPSIAGSDVVMRTVIGVPSSGGAPIVVSGALDVMLAPGWYALVFGTGAFGGTATGTIPSGGGTGCVSSPGSSYPFTIRQSDGMFILQGAEPHFFVEVAP